MDRTVASLSLTFWLALTACDPSQPAELRAHPAGKVRAVDIYPGQSWATGAPQQHGLSADGLTAMSELAEELDSTCMLVIHDGVLVHEWYAEGYGPDTVHANLFSVTKSVTSTLVGIAQAQDLLALDDEASEYIDPWMGTTSEGVTVRDLLSNDSGRSWSFEGDYFTLMAEADQTSYAISLEQAAAPGEIWEYNNSAIQTLQAVLEGATGSDVEAFAQTFLFERIGMTATLARDPSDNPIVYSGLSTTCPDAARLAYLMLRRGKWKNQQIVPAGWTLNATKPSTDLNDAYGFLWWLNVPGEVVEPSFPERVEYQGQLIPGSPESLYMAAGAFGQFLAVSPADEYVVVRLQNVTDLQAALATDPDPIGLTKVRALMAAFEAAKL